MALDFFAGCVGGCAGLLVGHPFDTIKVRLQTDNVKAPRYKSATHCFATTIKTESFLGLYKGISSPMVGMAFINAILFGTYGSIHRQFENQESLSTFFLAGGLAGMIQAFIASPMELVKTRIQIQGQGSSSYSALIGKKPVGQYKGPIDCVQKIYVSDGIRGVFRGQCVTLLREFTGIGIYFSSYEYLTQHFLTDPNEKDSVLSTGELLLAGGLAGVLSWIPTYPVDMIKSRLQVDGCQGPRKYNGAIDCAIKSYREEGKKAFTRGMAPTILRAFPTNAATFTVVAWIMRLSGYAFPNELDDKKEALVSDVSVVEVKETKHTTEPGFLASLKGIGVLTITREINRLAMYAHPCESKFLKNMQVVSQVNFLGEELEKKYADKMVPIVIKNENMDVKMNEGKLLKQDQLNDMAGTQNNFLSTENKLTLKGLSISDWFYLDLSQQDCELSASTSLGIDKSELLALRSSEFSLTCEKSLPSKGSKSISPEEIVHSEVVITDMASNLHLLKPDKTMDMSVEDLPSSANEPNQQVISDQRSNTLLEAYHQRAKCETRSKHIQQEEHSLESKRDAILLNEGIFIRNKKTSEIYDNAAPQPKTVSPENNSYNLEDSEVAPCSPTCNNNTRCCTYSMDFIEQENRIASAFNRRILEGMVRHLKAGLFDIPANYDI